MAGREQCYNVSKFTDIRRETAPLTNDKSFVSSQRHNNPANRTYWDVPIGHVTNMAGREQCYNVSKFTDIRRETAPLTNDKSFVSSQRHNNPANRTRVEHVFLWSSKHVLGLSPSYPH